MRSAPLIRLDGITRTYGAGETAAHVLKGISLSIQEGEFVAIMGASGSGKSTLMNILGCLDRPTSGSYELAGRDVASLDRDQLAALRREVFGFVFQQYHLLPHATAVENVEMPAVYAGMPREERLRRARALLTELGLGDRLEHRPSQLSGGQQQRVSIARALMNGGRVILADEPTGALDSRSGREVMALLHRLNGEGHTVILITHDPEVAAQARRQVRIADGAVVADEAASPERENGAEGPRLAERPPQRRAFLASAAETARTALRSMRGNLFRTALTLLGIVIGVGSVISMLAIGDGAKQEVMTRLQSLGPDLLLVRPGGTQARGPGASTAGLTMEDAATLRDVPGVRSSVPEQQANTTVRFGNADAQTLITGTSADFPTARAWPVDRGIFFDAQDSASYAPVAVLGKTVAENLFEGGQDPLGQYVLVRNVPFQVIGVMSEKGASPWGSDLDDVIFVPLTTGGVRLFGDRHLRSITVQAEDASRIDEVQDAVRTHLLARHGVEDFRIRNMASVLDTATQTQDSFRLLLGSIAAISLLVGGIGVMNIMLVSVAERTREIGIRMAAGARAANIQFQFLTEATVVCALGGLLGVAGGLGTAWLLGELGQTVAFNLMPVALAFGCAGATGLVFGYLPAHKAARLDPVVALAAD